MNRLFRANTMTVGTFLRRPAPQRSGCWIRACVLALCVGLAGCASDGRKAAEPAIAIVGATLVHPERDGANALAPYSTIVSVGYQLDQVGPRRLNASSS